MRTKLLLLFLFAFVIRLIALDQSFWLDETTTANVLRHFDFLSIVRNFSPHDFHPPLYYLFMKLWSNILGYSEIALRMPSVLFSLGAGWMIYKIAKWLNGQMVAWWATAFFLFNPLIVYYSQEARMYMMTTFLLSISLFYFLKLLRLEKPQTQKSKLKSQNLFLFNVCNILSFYTFYGSIFLITAMHLWLLIKKQYQALFVSCILFLVSFALISPLFYQQLINSQATRAAVLNWKQVLGPVNLKNLLLIPIKFTTGRIDFHPLLGLWTVFVFYFAIVNSLKIENWKLKIKNNMFLFLLLFPLALGFFVSFYTPLLQYFRFIYLIPILSLLLSRHEPHRFMWSRHIVLAGFIIFSLVYLLNPQFHREDWKSMSKSLNKDQVVYAVQSSKDPLGYYSSNLEVKDLKLVTQNTEEMQKIILPYASDIYGVDYKSKLNKSGFKLKNLVTFRGLSYEVWEK